MEKAPVITRAWLRLVLFLVCLISFAMVFSLAAGYLPGIESGENLQLVHVLISITVSIVTVYLFRKFIDRKDLLSLGLKLKGNGYHAASGFFMAVFLLGVGTLILLMTKNLEFTNIEFDSGSLYVGLGLMLLVALAEELVFRGYILNTLLSLTNKWVALIVSALVFALLHGANPGSNPLPLINVFLAGLVLGVNYIYTRNLWYAMLLHFAWNFFQGPVLGFRISGLSMESLLQQQLHGSALLTGGAFGLEGSIVASVLLLLCFLLLAWIYEKKFNHPGKLTPAVTA